MTDWKATYAARTLAPRRMTKIEGVYDDGKGVIRLEWVFVLIGAVIGSFIALLILRPELIDWNSFWRSFVLTTIIMR